MVARNVVALENFSSDRETKPVGPLISRYVRNGQRKARYMKIAKSALSFLAVATAMLAVGGMNFGEPVEARTLVRNAATDASDTTQGTIARAMSAGPDDIARSARIIDTD